MQRSASPAELGDKLRGPISDGWPSPSAICSTQIFTSNCARPDVIIRNIPGIARVGIDLTAVFRAEQLILDLAHPCVKDPERAPLFEHQPVSVPSAQ
jgi:hypothetical protein